MGRICCFTGPRPKSLFGYDRDPYVPLVNTLKEKIYRLYNDLGYNTFITGGAQGVDQLAFWAVNALKRDEKLPLNNIVFIPFPGQERMWKSQGLFSQQQYRAMLYLADRCEIIQNVDLNNRRAVINALYERNHRMVDASETVLGVFPDDSWLDPKTQSGTAECLRYARSLHKQIHVISPTTLEFV